MAKWTPRYIDGKYVKGQLDEGDFYAIVCFLEWLKANDMLFSRAMTHEEIVEKYNDHEIEQERLYS